MNTKNKFNDFKSINRFSTCLFSQLFKKKKFLKRFLKISIFYLAILSFNPAFASNGMDFLLGYSAAEKFDVKGASNISSNPAFTLGARIKKDLSHNFGVHVGLGCDSPRSLKGKSSDMSFVLMDANLVFEVSKQQPIYLFGGLNYPVLTFSASPESGFQFGTGAFFMPNLGVDFYYRTTNFEIQGNKAHLWGFGFRLIYSYLSF